MKQKRPAYLRHTRHYLSIFFFVPLLLALQCVHAQTEQTLIVAGDRGYPPYHYLDERGNAAGFDVEIVRALGEKLGYSVQFRLGDWEQVQNDLAAGDVDIIPMFVSDSRRERFLFSSPFLIREHLVFGKAGSPEIDAIQSLQGHRVAVQAGGFAADTLAALGFDRLVLLNSEPGAIAAVTDGRADYALITTYVGYQALRDRQVRDIVALSPPLLSSEYAFAVSPARPELVNDLNLALAELRRSGQFDRLYQTHLATLHAPETTLASVLRDGAWIILPLSIIALAALFMLSGARHQAHRHLQLARRRFEHMLKEKRARERVESRVEYLAFHDPLTALPNQHGFRRELAATIEKAQAVHGQFAIAIADILDQEVIRQIAGYAVADKVIQSLTKRLRQRASHAYAATFGPGTFAFILKNITDSTDARQQLESICDIVHERVDIDGLPLEGRIRCGWALYPDHGTQADELIRASELARNQAYEQNRRMVLYDSKLEPDPRNLTLMTDLRTAITGDHLDWAFQPKIDLRHRHIVGAEMLVRWQHPVYGPLPPNLFIPLAEKTGVINKLTRHLLVKALQYCRQWRNQDRRLHLAVNVSGNDLADAGIANTLLGSLDDLGPWLTLEVTETAIMKDIHACLDNILRLRSQGVSIALDDFGTGFSSLTYLKRLGPEELKIDQSFIKGILDSKQDMAIVKASIELSHELDARVTAEGIEDEKLLERLSSLNCDTGQGYGIARPMPYKEFMKLCDSMQKPRPVCTDAAS